MLQPWLVYIDKKSIINSVIAILVIFILDLFHKL